MTAAAYKFLVRLKAALAPGPADDLSGVPLEEVPVGDYPNVAPLTIKASVRCYCMKCGAELRCGRCGR